MQRAQLHLVDARNAEDDAVAAFDNALGLGGSSPNYQLVDVLTYSPVTEQLGSLVRHECSTGYESAGRPGPRDGDTNHPVPQRLLSGRQRRRGHSAMGTGLPAANNFDVGIVIRPLWGR